jgi:hypothetical protein
VTTVQLAGPSPTRGAGSPASDPRLFAVWPILDGGYTIEQRVAEAAWCLEHGDVDLLDERGQHVTDQRIRSAGALTWQVMPADELPWLGELWAGRMVLVATAPAVQVVPLAVPEQLAA